MFSVEVKTPWKNKVTVKKKPQHKKEQKPQKFMLGIFFKKTNRFCLCIGLNVPPMELDYGKKGCKKRKPSQIF